MGLAKLTAGDGYTYLTRQVAAHDSTEKGHASLADYYSEHGESPGQWLGRGIASLGIAEGKVVTEEQMKSLFGLGRHPNAVAMEQTVAAAGASESHAKAAGALGRPFNVYAAASAFNTEVAQGFTADNLERGQKWNTPIPVEDRARIRSRVGTRMFEAEYGRPPEDARELSGFIARSSRQATTAVAGYDLVFSPVKSVSVLWALTGPQTATVIRAAHDAAVADTLAWIEREVAFTREGRGGARQVAIRGLVGAAFTHRDTRAGDPDLHTHLAVSNKVQTREGRWLALDGRVLYQATVNASEHYNTRLEAELVDRLGVRFHDVPDPNRRRPVREIVGVNPLLIRWWSRRRRAIEGRQAELSANFQARHARPPTPVEAIALAKQATLETRDPKHAPTSEASQRATWKREATEVLGGGLEVEEMEYAALHPSVEPRRLPRDWHETTAAKVIGTVESERATWQIWHVRAEAERQARAAAVPLSQLDDAVGRVVDQALKASTRLGVPDPVTEPVELRRANGESVYDVHGSTRFTSVRVLAAEHQVLDLAKATGGPMLSEVRVGIAAAESAANGVELNDAQDAMVRDLATSGRLVQLALAPAGTGKTTAMRVLTQAWTDSGGEVLGLAPSAQAASELGRSIGVHTDTLAKLTWTLAHAPLDQWPDWVTRIGPNTLVIIDEAGQVATAELAAAAGYVTARSGIVRLIGDDQQLAAFGAGGVLRDIECTIGAATLSEVRRFDDAAEAAATLAVREGDAGALGFYADNHRIHVGDIGSVTDQAYDAWSVDRAAGRDTILLAPTREVVARLNARARTDRLRAQSAEAPREVHLSDGNRASVGDVIISRRNQRRLAISGSDWVKNGDRWTLTAVAPDGSIRARRVGMRATVRMPADYVAESVELGYASTVHAAQGMTVDTCHTVVAGNEARQLLYVALSRGRAANHVYLASAHDGDPHNLIRPEALLPPTAVDVLADILQRDGSQQSATTAAREADSPAVRLHEAVLRYHDALAYAAEHTVGLEALTQVDCDLEVLWPGITAEPAYPTLRGHLALRALDGADAVDVLAEAAAAGELGSSADRAAVLDWRLTGSAQSSTRSGPLPWLAGVPDRLGEHELWGPYLDARAARVHLLTESVQADARSWEPSTAPTWAVPFTAKGQANVRTDLAVWRAAFGVAADDSRPTGPVQPSTDVAEHQRTLDRRVRAVVDREQRISDAVAAQLPDLVRSDPAYDRLSARLAALEAASLDVGTLLTEALERPDPLPDERTADALWWRVVGHLGPAALRASRSSSTHLRPPWVPSLIGRLGTGTAERVMADPAWPALVAAIGARPSEWSAEDLIEAVTSQRDTVADTELCWTLVWRVATMTDTPPDEVPEPPDPTPILSEPRMAPPHTNVAESETSPARILELNQLALNQYAAVYPRSWAPKYLHDRLGTALADDTRFTVGYAPPGPQSLIRHLTELGASASELIAAGLARATDRGALVDTFRDRMLFPIHSDAGLVGFIGRRNPTKDDHEYTGPKYLNSRTTPVFTKGEQLFGLTERRDALAAGATPVLVEGPMDAIAVTLASQGRSVGIAPLGTAFTQSQADRLASYLRSDPTNIVIATDPDEAGWACAQRAFWRLAAMRADPRHLVMPAGHDPADLLRTEGTAALGERLAAATSFGTQLIDRMIEERAAELVDSAARIWLARDLARVIGALPPHQWIHHIHRVEERLEGLPPGLLGRETLEAGTRWTDDPVACARRELAAKRARVSPVTVPRRPAVLPSAGPTRPSQQGGRRREDPALALMYTERPQPRSLRP